jgi:hypothetical protein
MIRSKKAIHVKNDPRPTNLIHGELLENYVYSMVKIAKRIENCLEENISRIGVLFGRCQ